MRALRVLIRINEGNGEIRFGALIKSQELTNYFRDASKLRVLLCRINSNGNRTIHFIQYVDTGLGQTVVRVLADIPLNTFFPCQITKQAREHDHQHHE